PCQAQRAYIVIAMNHDPHPCSRPASSVADMPMADKIPETDSAMARPPDSGSGLGSNPPGSIGTASRPATTKLLWEPPPCAAPRELSITPVRRNPCGNGARLPLRSEIAELIVIVPATPFDEEVLMSV